MKKNQKKVNNILDGSFENNLIKQGYKSIIGIDEVGRGCFAGPFVIGAFVFTPKSKIHTGVNDSKKLSKIKRKNLYRFLSKENHGLGIISSDEVDSLGLTKAFIKGIEFALDKIDTKDSLLLIDGNNKLNLKQNYLSVIKGDSKIYSIASASILAKVYRDSLMLEYSKQYPNFGFEKNVGYGTKFHIQALEKYGICPIHRKSYKPIKNIMNLE